MFADWFGLGESGPRPSRVDLSWGLAGLVVRSRQSGAGCKVGSYRGSSWPEVVWVACCTAVDGEQMRLGEAITG